MDNSQPFSPGGAPGAGTPPTGPINPPQPKPFTPPAPNPFASAPLSSVPPTPPPLPRPMPTPPPNIPMGPSTSSGNMEVRTMASDVKSVQETGGGAPRPYVPPQAPSSLPPLQGSVRPASAPSPAPNPVTGSAAKKPSGSSKKGIFTLIISLVIVVGAGVVGYFYVFPLFSGSDAGAPAEPTPSPALPDIQPPPPAEEESGLFEIPSGDIGAPAEEERAPTTPPPAAPSLNHTSYLSIPSDMTSNVAVENVTASALRQAVGFKTAQVASLKEVVLTQNGISLRLSGFAPKLVPELFIGAFDDDFTYAVYTDAKGSWPVYIFRLASGADGSSAKSQFAAIEQASAGALGNLFLSSPGGASLWKDGQVLGTSGRYMTFTQNGASLNYVWIENFVVLGTNYAATQEAVKRLGS